ncbi:unnamed protein product, partial [Musa hybrid cultivar]
MEDGVEWELMGDSTKHAVFKNSMTRHDSNTSYVFCVISRNPPWLLTPWKLQVCSKERKLHFLMGKHKSSTHLRLALLKRW